MAQCCIKWQQVSQFKKPPQLHCRSLTMSSHSLLPSAWLFLVLHPLCLPARDSTSAKAKEQEGKKQLHINTQSTAQCQTAAMADRGATCHADTTQCNITSITAVWIINMAKTTYQKTRMIPKDLFQRRDESVRDVYGMGFGVVLCQNRKLHRIRENNALNNS